MWQLVDQCKTHTKAYKTNDQKAKLNILEQLDRNNLSLNVKRSFFCYNLLWVSGDVVCKQMNSNSLKKDERATGHCSKHTQLWIPANFFYSFKSFFSPSFCGIATSGQTKSFIRSFNPSLYLGRTQNQVPRSALVAKSERAASGGAEVWIALQNWFSWIGGGKTFNRIRGRFCTRNLLSKQVEMGPSQLCK